MFRLLFVSLLLVPLFLCSCASTKSYLQNRVNDGADIITLTVGQGIGVRGNVMVFGTGLYAGKDVAGLRAGEVAAFDDVPTAFDGIAATSTVATVDMLLLGTDIFCPSNLSEAKLRHKLYSVGTWYPFRNYKIAGGGCLMDQLSLASNIELAIGIGGSLRLGMNPTEFIDFLIGFSTLEKKKGQALNDAFKEEGTGTK